MQDDTEAARLADLLDGHDGALWVNEAANEIRRLEEAHDWQYAMAGDRLKRIEALEASHYAYASEFPLDDEGFPDKESILHNIRSMKAENAKLQAEVRQLHLKLADSVLLAETGWSRYESANRMRNKLLEDSELHARANAGY